MFRREHSFRKSKSIRFYLIETKFLSDDFDYACSAIYILGRGESGGIGLGAGRFHVPSPRYLLPTFWCSALVKIPILSRSQLKLIREQWIAASVGGAISTSAVIYGRMPALVR